MRQSARQRKGRRNSPGGFRRSWATTESQKMYESTRRTRRSGRRRATCPSRPSWTRGGWMCVRGTGCRSPDRNPRGHLHYLRQGRHRQNTSTRLEWAGTRGRRANQSSLSRISCPTGAGSASNWNRTRTVSSGTLPAHLYEDTGEHNADMTDLLQYMLSPRLSDSAPSRGRLCRNTFFKTSRPLRTRTPRGTGSYRATLKYRGHIKRPWKRSSDSLIIWGIGQKSLMMWKTRL